ncbi:uncharacterized protein LOC108102407 isoform X2 [Drosophila eugracilis]|uniref:uncharacterized protein LOC108102407 isoform X2 n=1 Tax=Drosophila eugracilis TaxID=29029 RepID=UPI0007E68DAE|nr:uncharacterized protein LOC108102407 isoform X2 [Drosophila eugracilis]
MVVGAAAADVVENISSKSGSGDSCGIVSGTAESPPSVGAIQATAVNNNHTDKNTKITTTKKEALEDSECRLYNPNENKENCQQVLEEKNSCHSISNIINNNMTDAAKGIAATKEKTTGSEAAVTKSAVSQRNVDIKIDKTSNMEAATQQLTRKVLKLDLGSKNIDEFSLKSPKSPISARLPHQTSITSSVDVEDRKTLREALYQGIFHRHRRTIFAVGSFLRMLRSRNSQYNTIRSSSDGEDIDERPKHHQQELEQSQKDIQPGGQEVTTTSTSSPSDQQ